MLMVVCYPSCGGGCCWRPINSHPPTLPLGVICSLRHHPELVLVTFIFCDWSLASVFMSFVCAFGL